MTVKRDNLAKIADSVEGIDPEMFNIAEWRIPSSSPAFVTRDTNYCSTIGCAIGWMPFVSGFEARRGDEWGSYVKHITGLDILNSEEKNIFRWCFDMAWTTIDNTPEGVAARIRYYLDYGVPKNLENMIRGIDPVCYRDPKELLSEILCYLNF